MTPDTDELLLGDVDNEEEQTSKTYYLDIEKNSISRYCDGIEAMKQAIYCILNTERFNHIIYSWDYGIELENLIGENIIYVIAELERVIREALIQDTRIVEVNDFEFERGKKQIKAKFTVVTVVGDIEMERVVSI